MSKTRVATDDEESDVASDDNDAAMLNGDEKAMAINADVLLSEEKNPWMETGKLKSLSEYWTSLIPSSWACLSGSLNRPVF